MATPERRTATPRRSKAQLAAELRSARHRLRKDARLRQLVQTLEVQREEIRVQQEELLASKQELERSRDRFADLFDFAPVGYAVLDAHGVIENLNVTAARLLGRRRRAAIGLPFVLLVGRQERRKFLDHLVALRRGGSLHRLELDLERWPKGRLPVLLTTRRMQTSLSQRPFFYLAIADLRARRRAETEQAKAEAARRKVERDERAAWAAVEARDQFLAMLSHELRTPLAPILFTIGALERQGGLGESLQAKLEMIRRNVVHEARLIDDLLDLTRIARGKLQLRPDTVDVHALLEDLRVTFTQLAEQVRVGLSVDLVAERHHVRADPTRLRQVFWNLVDNALRCTPRGGTVLVRSGDVDGRLAVALSDTGVGIDREMLARVFLPFEQAPRAWAPRGGLGLGLAISQGLVEAHGGRISVTSDGRGTGSTFTVELDTVEAGVVAVPVPAPAPVTRSLAILVVEDDDDTATALEETLRLHGHRVRRAAGMREGLALAAEEFDVLVSDIGLPDGSGLDLMRQLRRERPIRGIAVSGYGTDYDEAQSHAAGFDCHLTKPVDTAHLLTQIARVVHP